MKQETIDKYNCTRCKKRAYTDEQIGQCESSAVNLERPLPDLICEDCFMVIKSEQENAKQTLDNRNSISTDLGALDIPRFIKLHDDDLNPKTNQALKQFMNFLINGDSWCFYLCGEYGSGKTHLIYWTLKRAIEKAVFVKLTRFIEPNVKCVESGQLVSLYQAEYKKDGGDSEKAIKKYRDVNILFIDDLGAERESDDSRRIIEDLLCYRYNNCLKTIMTANVPISDISARYSGRLASRLSAGDNCVLIHNDRRAK